MAMWEVFINRKTCPSYSWKAKVYAVLHFTQSCPVGQIGVFVGQFWSLDLMFNTLPLNTLFQGSFVFFALGPVLCHSNEITIIWLTQTLNSLFAWSTNENRVILKAGELKQLVQDGAVPQFIPRASIINKNHFKWNPVKLLYCRPRIKIWSFCMSTLHQAKRTNI